MARVLEVGCNIGGNLEWIADDAAVRLVVGVDVNDARAARPPHARAVGAGGGVARPRVLPFRDRAFDLVFTMGVLIHQPDDTLSAGHGGDGPLLAALGALRRVLRAGDDRGRLSGQEGALFKRDYGRLFCDASPDLTMTDTGFLSRGDGWDDVTWWLLERR